MGASLSTATSTTPGVLVAGTVDPTSTNEIVRGTVAAARISDQIDASYIVDGETAYWTYFLLHTDGTMWIATHTSATNVGTGSTGPQFTEDAEDNIWIVIFYGSTSAAWEFAELDASDEDEPYTFTAASVTAAGPTNDAALRAAIQADTTVVALLVDGNHPNIDIANLEIADPPTAPTAPTVSSTGQTSISAALSADPTSDSTITSRDIRWKVASEGDDRFVEVLGVTSPHTVSGLTAGTEYAVQWRANMGAQVTGIAVTAGGSGYTSAPTVTISGGGGSGATATATVASGAVTQIAVTNAGSGYTSAPTVTLSGGGGSGATATATFFASQNGAWSPSGTATTDTADLMPDLPTIDDVTVEQGAALDETLPEATGGDLPITYSMTGLASWMSFDASTRRLTGTAPNASSSIEVTYIATDTDGDTASRSFDVDVLFGYSDFDVPSGRVLRLLMVIEGEATGNPWEYKESAPPAAAGSVIDESNALFDDSLTDDIRLTWLRFDSSQRAIFSRRDGGGSGEMSDVFDSSDGELLHGTWHIQHPGSTSVAILSANNPREIQGVGDHWLRYNPSSADKTVIGGISGGDRVIVAFTMPADRDVTAAHTLQNVSAAAAVEQVAPAATDVSAAYTLQNVSASAAVEQFMQTIPDTDVSAAHTLQNVTAAAVVEQVAVDPTDVSASHTLQNVSASAAVEQVEPADRDVSASHTLQNVTASVAVQQVSGVVMAAISDQTTPAGQAFTFCVPDATGGSEPYTYTATNLPPGLNIHAATGLIYGVPSVVDTTTVTVTVTEDGGDTDSTDFDITVETATLPKTTNVSLNDSSVTSSSGGVLVKGDSDPYYLTGNVFRIVDATAASAIQTQAIPSSYFTGSADGFWTVMGSDPDGAMQVTFRDQGSNIIQLTEAAEDAIWIVVFYDENSAAWDFSVLDNADESNPYSFDADTVDSAGPTFRTRTLESELRAADDVAALLVDSSAVNIDIDALTWRPRSDWQTEAVPTVSITTPDTTIYANEQVKIAADVSRGGDDDILTYAYSVDLVNGGTFLPSYGKDTVYSPNRVGTHVVTQTVQDEDGNTATDTVTITVIKLTFVEIDDIGVEIGSAHTSTLPAATDGIGPYTYAVTNLPTGATFDASTRELAWTPGTPGGAMVTYTATDTANGDTFSRSFLLMAHLPSLASYVVLVDWDGDKTFGHANADVFPDVDRNSALRVKRGRNYGSQVYGRSISGKLQVNLLNFHGRYDKDSSTSPLAGLIVPRRRILWAAAAGGVVYRLWAGFLDRIDKQDRTGGDDMARMEGSDIIAILVQDDDASIPYTASTTTGAAADAIVEAGEVDPDDLGEFEGSTALTHFYQGKSSSWRQLQAVEEAEGGFLNVSGRGRLSMDARDARATRARSTTVQMTLTDSQTPGAGEVGILPRPTFRDPLKDLANLVRARVRTWTVGDEVDLWELDGELVLSAGDSITLRPQHMPTASSPAVAEWTVPQPCVDYKAWSMTGGAGTELTGSLDVEIVPGATEAALTLTNEHPTATLYVDLVKLRGMRLEEGDPVDVEVKDDTSIAAYGVRPYTIATDLLSTVMDAKDYADEIIRLYAGPTRKGAVRIQANAIFADALPLELSDRVNLTLRDFTGDMYLEAIGHALTPGLRHDMELVLSQVP